MITDTDRLEFLCGNHETQGYLMVFSDPTQTKWVVWDQSNGLVSVGEGATMREAIDQAMENFKP